MAYLTFTDALLQAKRRSRLTGQPFSTRDTMNLGSAYMSGAAERSAGERASALNERTLSAQEKNFADTLALDKENFGLSQQQQRDLESLRLGQERELSGLTLAEQRALAERGWEEAGSIKAANLAQQASVAGSANQNAIDINNANLANAKLIHDQTMAQNAIDFQAQLEAQNTGQEKALTGSMMSTGAILGGAYLLRPAVAGGATALEGAGTFSGLQGGTGYLASGAQMGGGAVGAYAYPVAAGVIGGYGGAYLGRATLGGGKQQTGSIVGGALGGAAAGAATGAAYGSAAGPYGTVIGGVIGGVVGGVGAAFGWW